MWTFAVWCKKFAFLDCCFVEKMDLVRGCNGLFRHDVVCKDTGDEGKARHCNIFTLNVSHDVYICLS